MLLFFLKKDYQAYLYWLSDVLEKVNSKFHSYALMTNNIHLSFTPNVGESVSSVMQYIGRYYVPFINKKYGNSGSIWEGRFKASLVQDETYLLQCKRYRELNPAVSGMVNKPDGYVWSSYRFSGKGEVNALLTMHECYKSLRRVQHKSLETYLELVKGPYRYYARSND